MTFSETYLGVSSSPFYYVLRDHPFLTQNVQKLNKSYPTPIRVRIREKELLIFREILRMYEMDDPLFYLRNSSSTPPTRTIFKF